MSAFLIGWSATALYLIAQAYISLNSKYNKKLYYLMNILAGAALALASVSFESWQAVVVNSYWALISAMTLLGIFARLHLDVSRRTQLGIAASVVIALLAWTLADRSVNIIGGVGWIGMFLYCGSYFLLSIGSVSRIKYLWVNAASGALLLPVYMQTDNWPSFTLNVIWIIISVVGALRQDGHQVERVAPTNLSKS